MNKKSVSCKVLIYALIKTCFSCPYRDRDRYSRSRRRSRTRSPRDSFRGSRSEIDKAKLLAIAKKNAVKLLTSDNLMGMDHDRLIAIKSGGQSLRQLTDFCREIAAKGNLS